MNTIWHYPCVVAHRGGGYLAPENTLAGIRMAIELGQRMIEIDAKLSLDNKIFLLHDDSLDRTTNGFGVAGNMGWQDLVNLDAGSWFNSSFMGERLPLIEQVASLCFESNLLVNLEIKPTSGTEFHTGNVIARAAHLLWHRSKVRPLLSSFSVEALQAARLASPELPRGLLLETWTDNWQAVFVDLECVSIHINHSVLDRDRTLKLKEAGARVMAYTVNEVERARILLKWGVDIICTDAIDKINLKLC